MPFDDDHGLTGKWKLVANGSWMTLGIVALVFVYLDMRSFVLSEIEYQRADVRAWHDNVTAQHRVIIEALNSVSGKLDNLNREIHRKPQ